MDKLIAKLNFRGENRILVINAKKTFIKALSRTLEGSSIDIAIDSKFLYNFVIVFAESSTDVDNTSNAIIHNLYEDGILWYLYPKNPGEDEEKSLTRKKGWNSCKELGFEAVRHICVDDKVSATRFRNKKYISRRDKG